ncbi:hypothetical protein ALC57_03580 [Trachymyrmex cornetzi]|uniref:Uncharacterized protein n=1 Tax=Trachymyrmex cornetzi TaxID=471704 RepID=A0A195EGF9_9HYME|nr:hypothetical protein ALC57_03580 [Trachymyrmex cornetzi]
MNNNNSNINNNNIAIDRYNIKNNNNINKSTTSNNMPTRSYRHTAYDGTSVGPILFSSNCSCPPCCAHLSLRHGQVSRTNICDIYRQYVKANPTARCDILRNR